MGNQRSIEATRPQVQVGSSIPEGYEAGVGIQGPTELQEEHGTPRTVNPLDLGVIVDTPTKAKPHSRHEESPISRLGRPRGSLFGGHVDRIDKLKIYGTGDTYSVTRIRDESQFEPEPHREYSVDLDSQSHDEVTDKQNALLSDIMFEEPPELPEAPRHTAIAEVPDSAPFDRTASLGEDFNNSVSNGNYMSAPSSFRSKVTSSRISDFKEPRKLVTGSLQDNEEEVETASNTEEDEIVEVADTAVEAPEIALQNRAPQEVIVAIPPRSSKRKVEQNIDPSAPEPKRAKSGQKKSTTPIAASRKQAALPTTPSPENSKSSNTMENITKASARTASPDETVPTFVGGAPVVAFSNSAIPDKPQLAKFIKNHCKALDKDSMSFDVLVVGRGKLKKTSKLLQAFANAASIVTDEWVVQSSKAGHLLQLDHFTPTDRAHEEEWGIKIAEAMGHDRSSLFAGKTLFITPGLKKEYGKGYNDIVELAALVGIEEVISKPARSLKPNQDTIVLGLEEGDNDVEKILEQGTCYSKDFLSTSIIRGTVDLDSNEFQLLLKSSQSSKISGLDSGRLRRTSTPSSTGTGKGEQTATTPAIVSVKKRGRPPRSK